MINQQFFSHLRLANEHLKTVNRHIENLEVDFADGLIVITLVEVLSGKRLPKHNRKPTLRAQKLENVNIALRFLTTSEGIKIVNIGKHFINVLQIVLNSNLFSQFS